VHNDRVDILRKEKTLDEQYNTGKVIVIAIAILNIIFTIIGNTFGNFNFVNISSQILLSIALAMGVRWVRWIFVAGSIISIGIIIFMLPDISRVGNLPMWIYIMALIDAVISGGLLIFNKCVITFFNIQHTRK